MNAVIKWTLLQRKVSTIWWSIGLAALIFLNMIVYPSFKDQAAEMQKSFENLPDAAIQLFGGSTDFFSPIGYMNSQIFFLTLPLVLGVLAISLGSNLIAREEQDGTVESILSRPISRTKFLLAKGIAGLIILAIVSLVTLITTVITAKLVDLEISSVSLTLATLACFALALSWGTIAFLITSLGRARVASVGISALIALGGYIVSSLSGTVEFLKAPSKVLPFEYYQPEAILRDTFNWYNILYFIGVIVICVLVSLLAFRKRDIY